MSSNSKKVNKWRKSTKKLMVDSMGGKCVICGYCSCIEAMDFHHIDPSTKNFSISQVIANPKKWNVVVEELRRCVLLCSNCHREVEAGVTKLPNNYIKFDESYINYREVRQPKIRTCKYCNTTLNTFSKSRRCCDDCKSLNRRVVKRPTKIELQHDLEKYSWAAIGRKYNVSDNAVRKWAKKYELI
jgi:protein-arginine kinase activator protein McsA